MLFIAPKFISPSKPQLPVLFIFFYVLYLFLFVTPHKFCTADVGSWQNKVQTRVDPILCFLFSLSQTTQHNTPQHHNTTYNKLPKPTSHNLR